MAPAGYHGSGAAPTIRQQITPLYSPEFSIHHQFFIEFLTDESRSGASQREALMAHGKSVVDR